MASLATYDEFVIWMGRDVDNSERAQAILDAASTLVRSHSGRAWVDDGTPDTDLTATQLDAARTVVLMVAQRVYNNPDGVTQQAAGPYSKSVAAWAAYGLELTAAEKSLIAVNSGGIPGLSSIRVVAPAEAAGSRWMPWGSELYEDDDE